MNLVNLIRCSLFLTFVVVMLGAYTRLADAGLGCPDWPGCYGQLTVPNEQHEIALAQSLYPALTVEADKAWLEMIHRYFAGTLGLFVFAITFLGIRSKLLSTRLSVLLSIVIVFQALLGMWTVTMKLMPIVVMGHLLGGFTLFCLLALAYWSIQSKQINLDSAMEYVGQLKLLAGLTLSIVVAQIALGGWTSSNYAALMCTTLPICQGDWVSHLDFKHAFDLIQPEKESYEFGTLDYGARMTIHVTHRIGALIVAIFTLAFVFQLLRSRIKLLQRNGQVVLALLMLQIALGIGNVMFSLPLAIAVAHNLGAALLLLSLLRANYYIWFFSSIYSEQTATQQGEYS
ncbi:COX15/CtaA family protein [Vibrio sp. TBV020]|uniref:COX15/CtaA family protein n=1 Tax=Vibrio sp. TBV020 TaxID=3137398 RepID=UPI0038CD1116